MYSRCIPGRTLRKGPFIFCNVFEISEHMRKLLRSTCLCCQMLPKVPVAQPLNSFIVLFWRIEKRSSVYHVLRHVGDQWNSIRIFAVKIAQDCVPYQHSTNLLISSSTSDRRIFDPWYFFSSTGSHHKSHQGIGASCTEMPKVNAKVRPPRIEATWNSSTGTGHMAIHGSQHLPIKCMKVPKKNIQHFFASYHSYSR
jgi:hypothetical protein